MATFNLTKSTTVATLKELFNTEFGAKLRIYSGRSQAEDSATLGELGLTNEGEFECRASLTVGSFIERMLSEYGLKVKIYTPDEWVAVLDGLTLESAGKVKKNAVKADMESMIAYQRTDDVVETAKAAEEAKARAAAEIAAAKAEAERMRAELETANKAKAEAEAARAEIERIKAEAEAMRLAAEKAKAEAEKAAVESTSIVAPEFLVDVILKSAGALKLQVIKVVKDVAGLSLSDARELVDAAPKAIKEGISKEEAETIKSSLEEAGAEVVIVKAEAAKAEIERIKAEAEVMRLAAEKAKAEAEKAKAEAEKAAVESISIVAPEFLVDVILKSAGDSRLQLMKVVKDVAGLSLGDAKELVYGAPKTVKEGISKEEAETIKASLEEAGAEVVIVKAEAAKAEIERIKAEAEKTQPAHETTKSNGELPGRFTINSKGAKVCFSRGLLQFNPAKYEFRFAENQYDIIGKDNEKIAPNYDGWIDLFGWGTSGYMGCQPTETSVNTSDYGPVEGDIAGTNYDWGVYNPITNGGNKEGLWRTPTKDEWLYLVNNRPNAAKLKALCTVRGVRGYMLMPDNFWETRVRIPIDTTTDKCATNLYNAEQWAQLESMGVVFIPYAGWRNGKVYDTGATLWTASRDYSIYAYRAVSNGTDSRGVKYIGYGVRLIKDVK